MQDEFEFAWNGTKYRVNNRGFKDTGSKAYFMVRLCPRCGKLNAPDAVGCVKCERRLSEDSIHLAYRKSRFWPSFLIVIVGFAVLSTFLTQVAHVSLGFLGVFLLLGLLFWIVKKAFLNRIHIDDKATESYRAWLKQNAALDESGSEQA